MAVTNSESLKSNGTFLGRRIARADGVAKVTGQADYALEHDLAGVVHAVIVESTVPSGRIGKIDLAAARTELAMNASTRIGASDRILDSRVI